MYQSTLQGKRLKIYTRSFSLELYKLSEELYKTMGIPCVRLTDQTADGYFYTMLKDTECDIAINIDEDAFVIDTEAILDMAAYMVENGYANAGCPDGGSGCPRGGNPIITNPFFNIFNLELIRTKFVDKKQIKDFDFMSVRSELENKYDISTLKGGWSFDITDYEPYYPFFFWLAYNFKTLYLHGEKHNDGISTILRAPNGGIICLHSWMARFYTMPSFMVEKIQKGACKQKTRIDNLISEAYSIRKINRTHFSLATQIHFSLDKLVRWSIKIPQRICGWPKKWKKWYIRYKTKKE